MMKGALSLKNFRGIDRRRPRYQIDPHNLWDAKNLSITRGGDLRVAPAVQKVFSLDPESIGLYAIGDKLHSVLPSANTAINPLNFVYDRITAKAGEYTAITAVETYDFKSSGGGFPYMVLRRANGHSYAHHYIDGESSTLVALPFNPGPSLVKLQEKLYAPDRIFGQVHYSSTVSGPRSWRDEDFADAGAVDAARQAGGDAQIMGLTYSGYQLVVFFRDTVQFWQADPDPANIIFMRSMRGPGTALVGTVTPVIADVMYLGDGGFRSLSQMNTIGEMAEGDIGAPIQALTEPFLAALRSNPTAAKSMWSTARSQYLCFIRQGDTTTVFAYTLSPLGGVDGWTYWEYDLAITDIVELNGVIYFRSGNGVYKFRDAVDGDINWTFETAMVDAGVPSQVKQWTNIDIAQEGEIGQLSVRVNDRDIEDSYPVAYRVEGSTFSGGRIPVMGMSHRLGIVCSGNKAMTLSEIVVEYNKLYGAG